MLPFLVWAQLVTGLAQADSVYATPALRRMVAAAAAANHEPPLEFRGYRARIETELALLVRDTLGRERVAQIEQLGAEARWKRMSEYDVNVIGYRSQSVGVPYSALSIVRAWTVPSLYGERLLLGAYFGRGGARSSSGQVVTVHPFAADRDLYYRFAGGDTVTTLRVGARSIRVARLHVTPRFSGTTRLGLFDGEIDLDADRSQIVRMRGQFVILGTAESGRHGLARLPGIVAVAYAEFINGEVDGRYWLPTSQRTEFQASIALLGQSRSVFRLVSRFDDYVVDSGGPDTVAAQLRPRIAVTYAPQDSMSKFTDWRRGLGVATSAVSANDFDDVGPDAWRPEGPPRFELVARKTTEILRYNRVEGLYTGGVATVQFRDLFPGLSAGVFGGWAWTEQTFRGGARAALTHGPWILASRLERELAITNDFVLPFDDGGGIAALLGGIDNADYVDRRSARLSATRIIGGLDRALMTVQAGAGSDHGERARVSRGLFAATAFRPNRGVSEGSYVIGSAELELHPNVTGDFVQPGLGARLRYEAAAGDLDWQRAELGLSARRYWGPISLSAHADGGVVISPAPPAQQLFELGGNEALSGYEYKEFAGDRAALFRAFASYRFPIWRAPIKVFRSLYMPGVGPGVAIGVQGGWTELSSDAARRAATQLGTTSDGAAISRGTDGMRATVGGGLTFFSDVLHVGVARPVDRPARWKLVVGFGQAF